MTRPPKRSESASVLAPVPKNHPLCNARCVCATRCPQKNTRDRPWLPWPMSEGRLSLQQQSLESETISSERSFTNSQGDSATERRGVEYQSNRSPSGVLVEAYARALPKQGGLVPEHVLREFCKFLVRNSFSTILDPTNPTLAHLLWSGGIHSQSAWNSLLVTRHKRKRLRY